MASLFSLVPVINDEIFGITKLVRPDLALEETEKNTVSKTQISDYIRRFPPADGLRHKAVSPSPTQNKPEGIRPDKNNLPGNFRSGGWIK